MDRRRALLGPKGEKLYFNEYTGAYYPKVVDFTPKSNSINNALMGGRYIWCSELEEVTIRGYTLIGRNGDGGGPFSNCSKLKKLIITYGCTAGNTVIAKNCPLLQEIQIGSVGHVGYTLYSGSFSNCGGSAPSKTMTIYVADTTTIPLSGAPWGYSGATVIYRSSTTGEIREVPT